MMITGATYPNGSQGISEQVISSSYESSFLYNLSLLKDKVHQVQSLATIFLSPDQAQPSESTAIAISTMGNLIQEIIVTASSMMFSCQQMVLGSSSSTGNNNSNNTFQMSQNQVSNTAEAGIPLAQSGENRAYYTNHHDTFDPWYGENYNNCNPTEDNNNNSNIQSNTTVSISNTSAGNGEKDLPKKLVNNEKLKAFSPNNYDIVELDAADLLAKYTHYCQICSKGFKRDANLRMHMRAHGDEYKSRTALSNPMKKDAKTSGENTNYLAKIPRRYSCPQEGCRWNKKHAKFQPLKSIICVKNHYKRSHCPKMYVCNRCNRKQFSVLSDLRTHEKHCGDLKWQCSCGTTFSRKDKLMGHVALFVGHAPVVN